MRPFDHSPLEAESVNSLLTISLNPKGYRISWAGNVATNRPFEGVESREIRYVSPVLERDFVY